MDMNMIIANNILKYLKKREKKQIELADALMITKQTVSKMLSGSRMINAVELKKISGFLEVGMDELTRIPETNVNTNIAHAFMGSVASKQAEKTLKIADELSDMILFHRRVRENGISMMETWEDVE